MRPELSTRRRVLRLTFQRYIEADRQWREALLEMKRWFPPTDARHGGAIGNPGSPVRRIYDARMCALLQFEVAQVKFKAAKQRLAARTGRDAARVVLRLAIERP